MVLAVDTCFAACQVAVLNGDTVTVRSEAMERGHQERLAGMVAEVLAEAGVKFADLSRIGVTVGPGSFTGLRVGLAFAKGMGLALGVPLVGVGALEALAAGRNGRVAAVLDARREQVHLQVFEDGASLAAPEAVDIPVALERLAALPAGVLVGPGADLVAASGWTLDVAPWPDIAAVAALAARLDPAEAPPTPLYLRGAYA
ncbi:MAG: tRNA (adenosine(37)-N6)-threonylcarbamoyltransferase complex dimerization subunit type 1 TsaB [Caulobacterales bacterium 68-7]|nr:tRNA (adenosine(37)-N6)-threonylcarbamoyltransferase complex dimerization subunit type 1 TsaB [Caulobacterales bacterium]OJU09506.1 MAG: tRNA (adenosine(37)-N6)-threonylcarbamoyltransferase complex dimerization subunit type 1 TsaB [Caulobacterales bacterium 68-7]